MRFHGKLRCVSHSPPPGSSNTHFFPRVTCRPGHQTASGTHLPGRLGVGSCDLRSAGLRASFTQPTGDALPPRATNGSNGRGSDRRGVRGILLKAVKALSGEFYGRAEPRLKQGRAGCGGPRRALAQHLLGCSLSLMASRRSSWTPRENTGNSLSGSKPSQYKAACLLKLKSTFCKERLRRRRQRVPPVVVYAPRFPAALGLTETGASERRTGLFRWATVLPDTRLHGPLGSSSIYFFRSCRKFVLTRPARHWFLRPVYLSRTILLLNPQGLRTTV